MSWKSNKHGYVNNNKQAEHDLTLMLVSWSETPMADYDWALSRGDCQMQYTVAPLYADMSFAGTLVY